MRRRDHALGGTVEADEHHARRRRHRRGSRASERVERVVHRELARHVVVIVTADRLEAGGSGVEPGGFGRQTAIVGVGTPYDRGEGGQRRIHQLVAVDERVEGAPRTLVTELHVRNVIGNRAFASRRVHDLARRDEQELRLRIDEAADEPRTGDTVDPGTFTRDPLHDVSP